MVSIVVKTDILVALSKSSVVGQIIQTAILRGVQTRPKVITLQSYASQCRSLPSPS